MLVAFASSLPAQQRDTTRARADTARRRPAADTARPRLQLRDTVRAGARRDTLGPPISPRRAFLYSVTVPGLGQTRLDRPIAGGVFFAIEITSIALATKTAFDLRYARAHQNDSVVTRYQVDPTTGFPVIDPATGLPKPEAYERNRYAGTRVSARRTHLEDWFALMVANHLFAGAEAFVSAQLWDLPAHVSLRALPRGAAIAASLAW